MKCEMSLTADEQLNCLSNMTKTTAHLFDSPPMLEGLRHIRNHRARHSICTRSVDQSSDLEVAFMLIPTDFQRPFDPDVQDKVIGKWRKGSKEKKMNTDTPGSVQSDRYVSLGMYVMPMLITFTYDGCP